MPNEILLLIKYTLLYSSVLMMVALGGMFAERSGIINIALEGIMVIGGLIYFAMGQFAILVPAIASLYFDIFSAVIQSYIFVMLTMSYVSSAECE